MDLKCFVCDEIGDGKTIKLFTTESLQKCSDTLQKRIDAGIKYKELSVPTSLECSKNIGYHVKCYRKFTAISSKCKTGSLPGEDNQSIPVVPATRARSTFIHTSSAGVLPKICIFCDHEKKTHKKKYQQLFPVRTHNFELCLKETASALGDFTFLGKIGENLIAKEAHYHQICWLRYRNKAPPVRNNGPKQQNDILQVVIDKTIAFIQSNIVDGKQAYLLSSLFKQFLIFYDEISSDVPCSYTSQKLEFKIVKTFSDKIKISRMKKKIVIHHPDLTPDQLQLLVAASNEKTMFKEVANKLRKAVLSIKPSKLPTILKLEDIKKGEVEVPEILESFVSQIIAGSDSEISDKANRLVRSISEDLIFAVSNGRLKPSKHIMLGLCISGLTSSRKVISILNRYGHTLSYSSLEEIETELCYSDVALSESFLSPSALIKSNNLATGVAFDNFDRYVETVNGKDTLHDTVGIAYQINPPISDLSSNSSRSSDKIISSVPLRKRRRMFQIDEQVIEPYRKKPKFTGKLTSLNDSRRLNTPSSFNIAARRDFLWMMSKALDLPDIPMWIGYNSKTTKDTSYTQKIYYLPPINQSPTSTSVVHETMKRALQISKECSQKSIFVTYDLAIAKIAFQIQSAEKPSFDHLFIQMGDFHSMMAFFHALGKFIEGCGLTDVLTDSDLLASGSVNGFLKGKHYNRCKRIHPIAALALQILHFHGFLESKKLSINDQFREELELISKTRSEIPCLSQDLENILAEYKDYCEETLSGNHGKTAQYYFLYVKLVNYYLIHTRSIREGNFELYTFIIPKLASLFFALNQPNYARWLIKYHDSLINLKSTHPDLMHQIESGCFAIKRTSIEFSRSPIDLTLEQTINADAANKLTGISHFTNSISARDRWSRIHSVKAEIISSTLEATGINKRNDIAAELAPSRIKKDREALNRLITSLKRHVNPFDESIKKDQLFNLATGRGVRNDISNFLLNVEKIGEKARNKFIEECSQDDDRLEKPIKRQQVLTFESDQIKVTRKNVDSKLEEEISNKNLFARMLAVSMEYNINISEILKYPLSMTPRALSHADGTFIKTDKSALMNHLEKNLKEAETPQSTDVVLIDGFFLLHTIGDIPRTFGQISRKFLQMATKYKSQQIFVVFDNYLRPSIKDQERQRRTQHIESDVYIIHGPDQIKPSKFLNCLRNDEFKTNFVKFIAEHWQDPSCAEFLKNKSLVLNERNTCYEFTSKSGTVTRIRNEKFECVHEEADTRLFYVITKLPQGKNVIIRCNDTDVLIILLGNLLKIPPETKLWLEVGIFSNNSLRFLNINSLFSSVGADVCLALPAFHAFTGCDTSSSFFKKGKITPFKIMQKNPEFVECFKTLHSQSSPNLIPTEQAEQFVCSIYGLSKCDDVNEARVRKFEITYKPKKLNEPLIKKFAKFDSLSIPPCRASLLQHLKRSIYQTRIWINADKSDPTADMNPEDYGWKIGPSGLFEPIWFEGDAAPLIVINALVDDESSDEEYAASECFSDDEEAETQ